MKKKHSAHAPAAYAPQKPDNSTLHRAKPATLAEAVILMIEDDPYLRELYERVFGRAGIKINMASDGQEGLEQIIALQPHFLFLDVMLPRLTGMEILKRIQEDDRIDHHLPVVMLTDLDQPGVSAKALELGALEFLSKNETDGQDLIRKVKDILGITDTPRV